MMCFRVSMCAVHMCRCVEVFLSGSSLSYIVAESITELRAHQYQLDSLPWDPVSAFQTPGLQAAATLATCVGGFWESKLLSPCSYLSQLPRPMLQSEHAVATSKHLNQWLSSKDILPSQEPQVALAHSFFCLGSVYASNM